MAPLLAHAEAETVAARAWQEHQMLPPCFAGQEGLAHRK